MEKSYFKSMPKDELPRERLIKYGVSSLTNTELLAIVLGSGSKKENVLELSKRLLSKDNIKSLSRKRVKYFTQNLGIGSAKACKLVAAFELGRRSSAFNDKKKLDITSPEDIVKLVMPHMSNLQKENFRCIMLDARQRIIKDELISVGTLTTSLVHPREIFHAAIAECAAALILLHNHPSGDPEPSEEDIKITNQIVHSGDLLGIEILDHIILGNKKYFSFKEKGYI